MAWRLVVTVLRLTIGRLLGHTLGTTVFLALTWPFVNAAPPHRLHDSMASLRQWYWRVGLVWFASSCLELEFEPAYGERVVGKTCEQMRPSADASFYPGDWKSFSTVSPPTTWHLERSGEGTGWSHVFAWRFWVGLCGGFSTGARMMVTMSGWNIQSQEWGPFWPSH